LFDRGEQHWLEEIDVNSGPDVEKLLVGNKCDLATRRVVSFDQGKQFADSIGCKFIEVRLRRIFLKRLKQT
jgi:Ras-related protein Rab-1A